MQDTLHVAIVGYGTAVQAAAVLLTRDGHRVEVFERASEPGPVGAGLLLQPTGLQVLWKLGLLPQALAHGAAVKRLYGETSAGRAVMDMRYDGLDARLFGLGMQRGALFALLDRARDPGMTMHCGIGIAAIDHEHGRLRDQRGASHGPFDPDNRGRRFGVEAAHAGRHARDRPTLPLGGAVVPAATRPVAVARRIAAAFTCARGAWSGCCRSARVPGTTPPD
jgi:2-polyprenyl-6-methoxyphenol hydroxylase-like FAD-dependent oxidoreductase